ncbi:hypothetical protein HDU91_005303 [Kappamyces sp. JEL0680]|nr:hypothetical protein HDU91_005303 [Kappamyces sp. JEL0680]
MTELELEDSLTTHDISDTSSTLCDSSSERAVNWNVDGITKYIPENIVDTSPLKYYTLDEQARIYIENLSANFPEPQRLCPESDLNNHLLRLGLLFFPEHGFNHGLCHLGEEGGFPQFRAACIHHGVYLSRHPALFHGKPSSSKTMRAQIANSLFPISISIPLPSQLTFDQVYDLIVGRLLHARTCIYNADLEKSYKVFMQGLYIAQMSGMLNVPANPDQLPKSEHGRIEIQLSVVNALLKMDFALAFIKGSSYAMDDSNYMLNLRLKDMLYRKSEQVRQITQTQGTFIQNDFGFLYQGSRLKTLQSTIFFVKFLRKCNKWNFKSNVSFMDRVTIHLQILEGMNKNADDGYKIFIPSIWRTPVNLLSISYVSTNIGQCFAALLGLVFVHSGNVTNRAQLFCAQRNGPEYHTSAEIIYGCIHTVARVCYYFQSSGLLKNEIRESFAEHLPPLTIGTGTWAIFIYGICSNALVALSHVCLKKETARLLDMLIRNHITPILKLIGMVWEIADIFSEWLSTNMDSFLSTCVIDETGV